MATPLVEYEHHGKNVKVNPDLKGRHREHCLCFSHNCQKFKPGTDDNCPIAQAIYENCVKHGVVTPVFECPEVEPSDQPTEAAYALS